MSRTDHPARTSCATGSTYVRTPEDARRFFQKKLRRSTICRRKFATLLSLATSAANSRTSPACRGVAASTEPGRPVESTDFGGVAGPEGATFSGLAGVADVDTGGDALETCDEDLSPCAQ